MNRVFVLAVLVLPGCGSAETLTFESDGNVLYLNGTINTDAPALFQDALAANPDADTLVLEFIDGSLDDDANLEFSRDVRAAEMITIVPDYGMVASGGTDLFLAGVERVLEPGACVGVHSWGDDEVQGVDLVESDPIHDLYLDYFDEMGIDADFYWFTLDAADADDMHWMTAAEVAQFAMTTEQVGRLSGAAVCDER